MCRWLEGVRYRVKHRTERAVLRMYVSGLVDGETECGGLLYMTNAKITGNLDINFQPWSPGSIIVLNLKRVIPKPLISQRSNQSEPQPTNSWREQHSRMSHESDSQNLSR